MAGNVWECCEDWYAPYDKAAQVDSKGPDAGTTRVVRSGSWNVGYPGRFRCASRDGFAPSARYANSGFRASRTIDLTP